VPSGRHCTIVEVRLLAAVWLLGIWQAAASLGTPAPATAALTVGAALLGVWALAAVRRE
jgi:hypothetical protein